MNKISTGWYKIYRPNTIDKYIFQNDSDKANILRYIENQDIPDILLTGHRGTGKTTLAYTLKNELDVPDMDFLVLNASDDNSVDVIRNLVKPFMQSMSLGKWKLIFFDEADALTPQAQDALKSMMEDEIRNARFILTCNKPHKLIPELKSRCTEYKFSDLDENAMKAVGLEILIDQGLNIQTVDRDELSATLDTHVKLTRPDLRKFITSLEKNFIGGELLPPTYSEKDLEILVELLVKIELNDWHGARNIIYEELPTDEISNVYSFLDRNLIEIDAFKNDIDLLKKGYAILGLYAHRDTTMVIPELNLTVCIIKLCELLGDT
jgi:DNA polymerase III delta prime subunit